MVWDVIRSGGCIIIVSVHKRLERVLGEGFSNGHRSAKGLWWTAHQFWSVDVNGDINLKELTSRKLLACRDGLVARFGYYKGL